MADNQPPVGRIRDGNISAAIWKQEGKEGSEFYSITFDRTYTDDEGNPKSSSSFNRNDLLRVARLANKAYDAIENYTKAS